MIWKRNNKLKSDAASMPPMSLTAFQLWALNEIVERADASGVDYVLVSIEIIRHEMTRYFGHQLKVHFLESDQRLWINGDTFSYENTDGKRFTNENLDFAKEEDFRESFKSAIANISLRL